MTDQEMLKIIAEMGPEARDAFEAWMSLQWADFWADKAIFVVAVALTGWLLVWLLKKIDF